MNPLNPDHPYSDPGDGRVECETCGKWVHLVIHSCKGVPATNAAKARSRSSRPNDWVYDKPIGSEVDMFIQWKGTDVCLDLQCACGVGVHVDGDFAYAIQCHNCNAVWVLGTQVVVRRDDDYGGTVIPTFPDREVKG